MKKHYLGRRLGAVLLALVFCGSILGAASAAPGGGDSQVTGVYKAGDAGYVVEVSVSGSQGMISMVVGVDTAGTVTGVSIVDMSETPGLGDKASEPEFRSQFVGTTGDAAVDKDGGTIAALTGATVTSRAVANGVNAAVAAAATIG